MYMLLSCVSKEFCYWPAHVSLVLQWTLADPVFSGLGLLDSHVTVCLVLLAGNLLIGSLHCSFLHRWQLLKGLL